VEAIKSAVKRVDVGTGTSSVVSGTGFLYSISSNFKEKEGIDLLLVDLGMEMLITLHFLLYLCR
jgi:hypothetical protein